jgi:hypothetical protein
VLLAVLSNLHVRACPWSRELGQRDVHSRAHEEAAGEEGEQVTEPTDGELLELAPFDCDCDECTADAYRAAYNKGKSDGAARLAHLEESARLLRELFRFGLRPTMVHEGMLAEGESLNAWLEADKEAP